MGTLAIGISMIMAIYALFLHTTYHYFFGNRNSRGLGLNGYIKKLKKFIRSMDNLGKLQKQ